MVYSAFTWRGDVDNRLIQSQEALAFLREYFRDQCIEPIHFELIYKDEDHYGEWQVEVYD
jgi:hypothetical protein